MNTGPIAVTRKGRKENNEMRRNLLLAGMCMVGSIAAVAQENAPTPIIEAGANFSYMKTMPGSGVSSFGSQGGSGTFVYNISRAFGVVADIGAYHNGGDANFNPNTLSYLFGPRFSLRKSSKFTPYARVLFGGSHVSTNLLNADGNPTVERGFATAFGGGLDIRVTNHVAIKPFQLEYLMTETPNIWSANNSQNNVRYSAGMVFRFGAK
jgi:outer membrane immunogenic protein